MRQSIHLPLVGVVSPITISDLKRHALFFDQFVLREQEMAECIDDIVRQGEAPEWIAAHYPSQADRDFLTEHGVLESVDESDSAPPLDMSAFSTLSAAREQAAEVLFERCNWQDIGAVVQAFGSLLDADCRLIGAMISSCYPVHAVPILIGPITPLEGSITQAADVVHVVVRNFPVPNGRTAWEQILEFRRDDRVRQFHADLRAWVNLAARSQLTSRELAGEIEAKLSQYESFMRAYRVERVSTDIEMVIKAAVVGMVAGVGVGDAAALLGAVASVAASVQRRKAQLLQAELAAPGAELAYIVKARERFGL